MRRVKVRSKIVDEGSRYTISMTYQMVEKPEDTAFKHFGDASIYIGLYY